MIIYNPIQKKEQEIEDLKMIVYNLPNKEGKLQEDKYIEFTVIGKNSKWTDWLLYRDFKNANENIDI